METGVIFTRMQAKNSIKLFSERSIATMIKELKQLEFGPMPRKNVVCFVDPNNLTNDEKKDALNMVSLIKLKRD